MGSKTHNLVEQEDALGAFFESLMRDVEAYAEHETTTTPEQAQADAEGEQAIPPATTPVPHPRLVSAAKPAAVKTATPSIYETLPPLAPPIVETPPEPVSPVSEELAQAEEIRREAIAEPEIPTEPPASPDWLGQELQAMLFKVAGLTLAVPLVDLNGVVEWDEDKLTAMPGHADFYLGLMSHLNRQIPVVDTARLVLPEKKRKLMAGEDPRQRITRVVLINDSRYGLACDEVNEVVTLKADAVRWRSERTQRRWLAGTVIEHMCALVDATAFAELLAERTPVDAFRE
jgi:purine-binding chemotaxis protein CheW